jgi:hypothetical protein
MKKKLQNLFLDYFNNFLSVEGFASWYGMSEAKAKRVIELGRKIHEGQFREDGNHRWV